MRRYFPGEALVGKNLADGRRPPTIVGVVGDVKATAMAIRPEPIIYIPMEQSPLFRTRLAVRTHGDPQALLPMIRRVVSSIDPDLPVFEVKTLAQIAADAVATQRFALLLFGLFAALALGLSVIGVYGVLVVRGRAPFAGVRRTRRAGREARRSCSRWCSGRASAWDRWALRWASASRCWSPARFEACCLAYRPFDVPTFAVVAVLFGVIVLAASLLPARRAGRADPMTTLRNS